MIGVLLRKLLRDVRTGLIVVAVLLLLFQLLWAVVTRRIINDLLPFLSLRMPIEDLRQMLFQGPGRIVQALIGGENIDFAQAMHLFSVSYVHPLTQTILCVWAVGRASGAIAGEIDRGTMELLLAQPIRRTHVVMAQWLMDCILIPTLCVTLWLGTWIGTAITGLIDHTNPSLRVDPLRFAPSLLNIAALVFAVSGYTMWMSAAGRFRGRVMGLAVTLTLLQFLINVVGQLWAPMEMARYLTVFYYFQPQPMILNAEWYVSWTIWMRLLVLFAVGTAGYLLAWWTFCKRDLPAPL